MRRRKYIYLIAIICLSFRLNAQTKEEIKNIQKYTNIKRLLELADKFEKDNKRALTYAKQKGWAMRLPKTKGIDGAIGQGDKVFNGMTDDLQPIYVESLNYYSGIASRANTLYTGGSLGLNVQGESMTAGVWEVDNAFYVNHEAFESRVVQMDLASMPTISLSMDHPTHVAGTIVASDQFQGGLVRGMAYKGNVQAYNTNNSNAEVTLAAKNGLLLSNHSYGSSTGSYYFSGTKDFDEIMYQAPYHLSVWAGGNGGEYGVGNINYYATCKNGLAVGASRKVLDYTGPSSVQILYFSSLGPSDDGRVKPDIVASAHNVFSTVSPAFYTTGYAIKNGTSMAAPTVTGTLLLLQQHYTNVNGNFMRASTLKGLALHTADEAGANPGPDITFGWGLINAKKSAETITNNGGTSLISEDSLATGSLYNRELIASGNEPLVATICWTDLPGISVGDNNPTPQLVNDLDLRVISNGTTYYPWKLDLSNVTGPAIQGDNDRDNIEKIEIPNPVAGQVYTLRVNHKGTLASNGQRFSVIVTGLEECVANRNIVSSVNAISVDHQQASARILATNTVNANAEAVYHAGDEVLMTDGFTAISGSTYRAYIENCTNDYAARKAVVERPVVTYNIPRPKEEIALADNAVYPNPGNGIFNVRVAGLSEGFVQITNLKGTEFYNRKFEDQGELAVNIKNETPGMYIVRVVSGNKVYTKTIVKF